VNNMLGKMRYKSFQWENNPKISEFSTERNYISHIYPECVGIDVEDTNTSFAIMTADGAFFGANAYKQWQSLLEEYHKTGPGEFYHPVYNKYNNALMIKLQATLGASVDYIEYKAEFIIYIKALGIEPKQLVVIPSANTSISPTINRNFNVGDIVIVNGYAYYTSYGTLPKTRLLVNEKFTVTYTNYKSGVNYPVHVGSKGWMQVSDVKLYSSDNTSSTNNTYVIKNTDNTRSIETATGISITAILSANNIKNPLDLKPGQILRLP